MEVKDKAKIIEEFLRDEELVEQFLEEDIDAFFSYNDLGIPIAQGLTYNLVSLTDEGTKVVNETWFNFCMLLEIDPNQNYETLEDCLFMEDDNDE